jgi:hypothetical protein
MNFRTGETIYEQVMSLGFDNNPVTGTTFDSVLYLNNQIFSGYSQAYSLTDSARGVFTFSWSSDTIGIYQLYVKNIQTNVIFVSDIVNVRPDSEFDTTVYVGL